MATNKTKKNLVFVQRAIIGLAVIAFTNSCSKAGFSAATGGSNSPEQTLDLNNINNGTDTFPSQNTPPMALVKPATETEALDSIDSVQTPTIVSAVQKSGRSLRSLSSQSIAEAEDPNAAYGGAGNPNPQNPSEPTSKEDAFSGAQIPGGSARAAGGGWGAAEESTTTTSEGIMAKIKDGTCTNGLTAAQKSTLKAEALTGIAELESLNPVDLRASVQVLLQANLNILKALVEKL